MRYANDLGAERSLVAVTAKTNRSKADKDPSEWMPPADSAKCTYLADWTATKLRWKLSADAKERAALEKLATGCSDTVVKYEVAPDQQSGTPPSPYPDHGEGAVPAGPGQHLHGQVRLHPHMRLAPCPPLPHHRRAAQGLTDTTRGDRLQARGHPGRPALVPHRQDQMVRSEPGAGETEHQAVDRVRMPYLHPPAPS